MFVIVNSLTKLAENYPNTSGLLTEQEILQWIDDMINNGGMGVDQELVESYEPNARPSVDEALMIVIPTTAYFNEPHPVHTQVNQWRTTYETSHRSVEEKKSAVDEAEFVADETTIPVNKRLKYTILAVDNILKHIGYDQTTTSLNAKNKKIIRIFKRIADKVRANDSARDIKHAEIDADPNNNPNLAEGWTLNDFTENV
jgi:hypothetical protein